MPGKIISWPVAWGVTCTRESTRGRHVSEGVSPCKWTPSAGRQCMALGPMRGGRGELPSRERDPPPGYACQRPPCLEASEGRKGSTLWRTYEGTRRGERREHDHGCET